MSMISVAEAIARLRDTASVRVDSEKCRLKACPGRVLASDIVAAINVPPADNSAMDGYALCREDWQGPDQPLEISQRIIAGTPPEPLQRGTAARIFTGAEIPTGADIVVMQEKCTADGRMVRIESVGDSGANIRPKGQDIKSGATVLKAGQRLRPQDIGLIASLGFAEVEVWQRLKVAIVSTGSELVEPGGPVKPGQIYNSNHYMLDALIRNWGFEVVDLGITEDDPQVLSDVMARASREADAIVTTGGVSVGEEDHVKAVVEALGHLDLWRVAIKPGKPFAFGDVRGTPFIGLPGNPVSALVTLLIIGRPFLFDIQGAKNHDIVAQKQTALFDLKGCNRQVYLRVRSGAEGVEMFSQQSSGALFSTAWGDGMVVQQAFQDIRHGDTVDVIPFVMFN
jgi:molybdopterin molybdotransferase